MPGRQASRLPSLRCECAKLQSLPPIHTLLPNLPSNIQVKLEHRTFTTRSSRTLEITTIASTHHIEISPGDVGMYDTVVVQEVIKEMASGNIVDGKVGYKGA